MKTILFLGDSLIEFFDWQARFPGHHVLNLGKAGETAEGLLARLGGIVRDYRAPDFVFVMTGINNLAMEDFHFLGPYRGILEMLAASYPGTGIFIHSILPTLLPWITNESIIRVNRSLATIAGGMAAGYIDLYRQFVDGKGDPVKEYLQPDGVHLSDRGYAAWAKALEGIIKESRP